MYKFYIVPIKESTYLTFHEFKNTQLQSDNECITFFLFFLL